MNEGSVYWFGICTVYLFDRHSYSCFFCSWVFIFVFFIKPSNFYFRFIYFLFVYIFFSFNTKDLSLFVLALVRSSRREVLLGKVVLKICSKFTEEHGCRSMISINLFCNFIETALRHGCSPVNLLHIFRTPFPRNTSGWLLLTCLVVNFSQFRAFFLCLFWRY